MMRSLRPSAGLPLAFPFSTLSALPLLLVASTAMAQMEPSAVPAEGVPMGGSELSSIMEPAGHLVIAIPIAINMSADQVAKPISIPLDIYYGVSETLSLGISHDNGNIQGVAPYDAGAGLCITGDSCSKAYNNISFDALLRLAAGTLQLAGHGGLDFWSLDPSYLTLRLGVLAKAPLGDNIAILVDPRLGIGLNKRDFNKEGLSLPLAVQLGTSAGMKLSVMTGVAGPLDGFGDAFIGWLGLFGAVGVNHSVDVFGSFTFENLYGKGGGASHRALVLGANIRL